jgi:hypothetical protein
VDRDESALGVVTFDQGGGYRIEKTDLVLFIEDLADRAAAVANITETEGFTIVNVPSTSLAHVEIGGNQVSNGDTYYRIAPPAPFTVERDPFTFRPSESLRGEYELRIEITVIFDQEEYDGTFFFIGIANDDPAKMVRHTINSAIDQDTSTADVLDIDAATTGTTFANGLLLATLVTSDDPDGGGSGGLAVRSTSGIAVRDRQGNDHATYDENDFEIRGNELWLVAGEQLVEATNTDLNMIAIEVSITTNGAGAPTVNNTEVQLEVV